MIALDLNGADAPPETIAQGGRSARSEVLLFGPSAEVAGSDVVDCPEAITNDDEPARAVRARPQSSIVQAAKAVAEGRAQALVSAGPTGAALAASLFHIRRLHGVHRPAVGALLPVPGNPTLLVDAGANVEARSEQLTQFAYMGAAFMQAVHGLSAPRVGLLSVGSEPGKGTETVVETHNRLAQGPANFVGNIEGSDVAAGVCDVVVTDGFTGNVALKLMEGTAKTVGRAVSAAIRSSPISALGGLLIQRKLSGLRAEIDPDTVGGAMVLGVQGVCVVAHGSASQAGIKSAVELAERAVSERMVERMAESLDAAGVLRSAGAASVQAERYG